MKTTIEEIIMDKLFYIGTDIPQDVQKRPKFVLLGTPQEFINEVKNLPFTPKS